MTQSSLLLLGHDTTLGRRVGYFCKSPVSTRRTFGSALAPSALAQNGLEDVLHRPWRKRTVIGLREAPQHKGFAPGIIDRPFLLVFDPADLKRQTHTLIQQPKQALIQMVDLAAYRGELEALLRARSHPRLLLAKMP